MDRVRLASGSTPLPQPESWECRWSGKHLDSLWAKGGVKPGISWVFLHKIPQAFQPREVEKAPSYFLSEQTWSPQRLPRPAVRAPKRPFPARKIPSLCLREEAFPSWNLLGHPGRRFQLDCRHRVAALSGHTGLLARSACLLGSQSTFPSFSHQLAMEILKSCFLGIGAEVPIARACLPKDNG